MKKIIIAGGRDFTDWTVFIREADKLLHECLMNNEEVMIVSGGARGADALGEKLAKQYNLPLKVFPALWDIYGKSAGYKRNKQMAEFADILLAFWNGESKGTNHMINLATEYGLQVIVVRY